MKCLLILLVLFLVACGNSPTAIKGCELLVETVNKYTPTPTVEKTKLATATTTATPTRTATATPTYSPVVTAYSTGAMHPIDNVVLNCAALTSSSKVTAYIRYSISGLPWCDNILLPNSLTVSSKTFTVTYSVNPTTKEITFTFDPAEIYPSSDYYLIEAFISN
jgi:hypothetical protein